MGWGLLAVGYWQLIVGFLRGYALSHRDLTRSACFAEVDCRKVPPLRANRGVGKGT